MPAYDDLVETFVELIRRASTQLPDDVARALEQGKAKETESGLADKALGTIEMDWFYMNFYPLIDMWGPNVVWGILGGITLGLCLLPFVVSSKAPVAKKEAVYKFILRNIVNEC